MTRGKQIIEEAKRIIAEAHERGNNDPLVDLAITLYFTLGARWADKNPHWISVEDKLPPKKSKYDDLSNNVLATDGKEIYESVYNHDFEDWFTHDMWGLDNITHWMPLPQAPSSSEKPNNCEKGGEE